MEPSQHNGLFFCGRRHGRITADHACASTCPPEISGRVLGTSKRENMDVHFEVLREEIIDNLRCHGIREPSTEQIYEAAVIEGGLAPHTAYLVATPRGA